MKAILDIGVSGNVILMMGTVGMELEGRHFRAVARRKGTLFQTVAVRALILRLTLMLVLPLLDAERSYSGLKEISSSVLPTVWIRTSTE